ncbi:MAG TPA: flagellar hook-basal body complex protein, partial [Nitrospirae bacterium]|nr:flagellar hook-basal body complex protein [Nitrospirota bacterium]
NIFFGYAGNNSTQYGSPSTTIFQTQDGWTSGSLRALTVGQDGVLSGVFTNGQVKNIAQVTIAKFTNPAGLTKMGRNMFAESSDSGQPAVGSPGTSGRGKILANSLEMSNIDLADEFVKMIAAQRGFQANTRVITTSDGLLGEVMNIVR